MGAEDLVRNVSNYSAFDQKQREPLKLTFSGTEMMLKTLCGPFCKLTSAEESLSEDLRWHQGLPSPSP